MTKTTEYKVRDGVSEAEEMDRVYQRGYHCAVLAMVGQNPHITENRFDEGKRDCRLWILKGSRSAEALISAAQEGLKEAKKRGYVDKDAKLVKNGTPAGVTNVNDGDLKDHDGQDFHDLAKGCWIVTAHTKAIYLNGHNKKDEPNCGIWVENKDGELELVKAKPGDFLPGNLVIAQLSLKPYEYSNTIKGVTCYLDSVERYADGQPFGPAPIVKKPPKQAPTRYGAAAARKLQDLEEEEMLEVEEPQPKKADVILNDNDWDDIVIGEEEDNGFELTPEADSFEAIPF